MPVGKPARWLLRRGSEWQRPALLWGAVFPCAWLFCHYLPGIPFGWTQSGVRAAAAALLAGLCLLRELLRALAVNALAETRLGGRWAGVLTALIFTPLAVSCWSQAGQTWGLYLLRGILPGLLVSVLLTCLAYRGGAVPGLLYSLGTECLPLLVPAEPAAPERLVLVIELLLPLIFLIVVDNDLFPEQPKRGKREAARRGRVLSRIFGGLLAAALCLWVAFFAGLLPWHPVSIATGSMEPYLAVGDVAVISTLGLDEIQVGDVIQFRRDQVSVVHRVVEIGQEDGETVYYTRGDANNANDVGYVTQEELIGKLTGKISGLGKLTLWLHSGEESAADTGAS